MKKIFLLAVIGFSNILTAQSYITGGYPINISEAPHQVALYYNGVGQGCGGSILNKEWIITAAHCVEEQPYKIVAGITELNNPTSNTQTFNSIEKIITHPQYNPITLDNDIALIKVRGTISFNQDVSPINLVNKNENLYNVGQPTKVSGWGKTSATTYTDQLLMVDVPIISNADAISQLDIIMPGHGPVTNNMIATSSVNINRKGACKGDSGGPLTTKNSQGKTKLIGIVSWGRGDCRGGSISPSIYTKVANYIDWIRQYVPLHIKIEGSSIICDNTTQTYTIDNTDNSPIQWQLSSDIEEVSRTANSITIKPKSGFNGLATLTASNGNGNTTKKIWVGKPKVKLKVEPHRLGVKLWAESAVNGVSLAEQGISIHWKNHTTGETYNGMRYNTPVNGDTMERVEATISNDCGNEKFEKWVARTCDNDFLFSLTKTYSDNYTLRYIRPCVEPGFYENTYTSYSQSETFTIQISNAMGQIVLTTKNKEFSLAHLLAGTYYARVIKNGQVVHTQTLLKQ